MEPPREKTPPSTYPIQQPRISISQDRLFITTESGEKKEIERVIGMWPSFKARFSTDYLTFYATNEKGQEEPLLLKVSDVAQMLHISETTIKEMAKHTEYQKLDNLIRMSKKIEKHAKQEAIQRLIELYQYKEQLQQNTDFDKEGFYQLADNLIGYKSTSGKIRLYEDMQKIISRDKGKIIKLFYNAIKNTPKAFATSTHPVIKTKAEEEMVQYLHNMGVENIIKFSFVSYQSDASSQTTTRCIMMRYFPQDLYAGIYKNELTADERGQIALEVLKGVSQMHDKAHVAHRDLKPENIMYETTVDQIGNKVVKVKIIDFEYARHLDDQALLQKFEGTVDYLSPEMFQDRDESEIDGTKVDAWALGIILYELRFGGYPVQAEKVQKLFKEKAASGQELPEILKSIRVPCLDENGVEDPIHVVISHLLHPDPKERWTSTQAYEELRKILTDKTFDLVDLRSFS